MKIKVKSLKELAQEYGAKLHFDCAGDMRVKGLNNSMVSEMLANLGKEVNTNNTWYTYEPWMYHAPTPKQHLKLVTDINNTITADWDGHHYQIKISGRYFNEDGLTEFQEFLEEVKVEIRKGNK